MEPKYKIIAGTIILLGLSILGHGWLVTEHLPIKESITSPIVTTQEEERDILSLSEASDYLNMSENEVSRIIGDEQEEISKTGSFTGMMFPYIKINGKLIFSKKALDKWAEEAAFQRKAYELN